MTKIIDQPENPNDLRDFYLDEVKDQIFELEREVARLEKWIREHLLSQSKEWREADTNVVPLRNEVDP